MNIGIVGAGHIGSNSARLLASAGHDILISGRDPAKAARVADQLGSGITAGTPKEAAGFGDVVMISVPWTQLDSVASSVGSMAGKTVIDTTNHFGPGGIQPLPFGYSAAQVNAERFANPRLVKAFNTLTAGFQASSAGRTGLNRVLVFMAGDDPAATDIVAELIDDAGFAPLLVGGLGDAAPMEAPRRPGALYGEEYQQHQADAIKAALASDSALPDPIRPRSLSTPPSTWPTACPGGVRSHQGTKSSDNRGDVDVKAIQIDQYGGREILTYRDIKEP